MESHFLNPSSANPTKWSNLLKQFVGFVGKLPTNCLSLFGQFVELALKRLKKLLAVSVQLYKKYSYQQAFPRKLSRISILLYNYYILQ